MIEPPDVTTGFDYALIHLDMGVLPLTRSADAHLIADSFREAAKHLEEVERRQALRQDKDAAELTNARFRIVNTSTPVGTLAPTSTVFVNACACNRLQGCETCEPADGAA